MITLDQAPSFYAERGIPKVRWMYPGKAYRARYMKLPLNCEEGKMYVYVLNDKYVIAYYDEAMTIEIGKLKLEHFMLFGHLEISGAPYYKSVVPGGVTHGMLLDSYQRAKQHTVQPEKVTEKVQEITTSDLNVTVKVLPPDPPQKFEQLVLF